jgi:hypothetical protein
MDHKLATDSMAVEKYLLGEMTSDERKLFEKHAFDCDECAGAIHDGITLLDNGRALVEADAHVLLDGENRFGWKAYMNRLMPVAAAVLAAVVGVQNFWPPAQPQVAAIQVLHGYQLEHSRGSAGPHLPAGKQALLYINITDQSYPRYISELRDVNGHVRATYPVTAVEAKDIVLLLLSPLPAGSYVLVVYGVRANGNRGAEVANEPFDVGP